MNARFQLRGWMAAALVLALAVAGYAFSRNRLPGPDGSTADPVSTVLVTRGALTAVSVYPGRYESRRSLTIASALSKPAELSFLAPEGAPVHQGQVIARFEARELEQDRLRMSVAATVAEAALQELQKVAIPTAQSSVDLELLESRGSVAKERKYLADSEKLVKDGLLSPQELEDQRQKLAKAEAQNAALEQKKQLTAEFSNPSRLQEARARVQAAHSAAEAARLQLQNAEIRATTDGVVLFQPTNIGLDYRVARVGDRIAPNQAFMVLTDLANLVVSSEVPEGEIAKVEVGNAVAVQPLAFADIQQHGKVEQIAAVAQGASGYPVWQKFFHVVIALDGGDARIRPGTSAVVQVLNYENPDAILVPRGAVRLVQDRAFAEVRQRLDWEQRPIRLGKADSMNYEVLEGLAPGEVVRVY